MESIMSNQQGVGISPEALFQQFTKNSTNIQSSFQLLYDTVMKQQEEIFKLKEENANLKGMPKTAKKDTPKVKIVTK
jgi:hypothetical protein